MKAELISVIVPVYNTEAYLGKCLDSICGQTYENLEILCVYTASTDGSLGVLEEYKKKDPRVEIIRRDDGGLGGARNTGMDCAHGDYILFVDSDDWIKPETCEELLELAQRNHCDAVIAPFSSVDSESGTPIENAWCSSLDFPHDLEGKAFCCDDLQLDRIVYNNAPVVAWNKLYSASFLKKHKLRFQEELRYEDNLFYYKVLVHAKRLLFTQKQYYFYRVNRKESLQGSSQLSESMFDIFPALYGVKELLLNSPKANAWPYALEYIFSEFEWRYFSMMGKQRRFLKKLREQLDREDYEKFVGKIREKCSEKEGEILALAAESLPQVTVIIPVYNCAQYIGECVESVLSQTLKELEVICVDDKSKDDSAAVVQKIAKRDNRVQLIKCRTNSGAGTARNIGLRHARGEFIFFLDGDDLLTSPDVLQTMYTAAIKKAVYAVGGNMECFNVQTPEQKYAYSGHRFTSEGLFQYEAYTDHPTWGFTRFLYNHEFIIFNDIAFPDCRYYEDLYFFVCFMAQCRTFWSITDTVYTYRVNDTQHTDLNYEQIKNFLIAMRAILPRLKTVSLSIYFAEYRGMISFFHEILRFLSQNRNRGMRAEISRMAGEILAEMDFSASRGYLSEADQFRSFQAFVRAQTQPKEPEQQGLKEKLWRYSQKHPALYRVLHAGNMVQRKVRSGIKKAYGNTMRLIFRPVINGILDAKEGELYAKTCVLQAEVSAMQAALQQLLVQNEQLANRLDKAADRGRCSNSADATASLRGIARLSKGAG